ncbi:MAG: diguanylate cyclase [Solirubrobacterales bacterium]|nr:diguanylate cyclase [Solirubrobacterales bacterium]
MSRRLRVWAGTDLADNSSATPSDVTGAANFAFMRRTGIAMFVLGAVTLLATLSLPDPDRSDHPALTLIAALLAVGAIVNWSIRTYRRWVLRATVIYGILLVSALMAVARPIEATPFFYLWPMLFSAYFLSRRDVAIDLVILWATLAIALFGWSNDPMKEVMFMGVGVSVTLTAVVVTLLREHLTAVIGQLAAASATDYLTGLLNRRAFDSELRGQIDRARRSDVPLALALFDLDHFKQINDRLGHAAGDRALCDFSALLRRQQRSGDTLARVGGEEFAIVLFGVGLQDAREYAERIGRELRRLITADGGVLSASAGVAALHDGDATPSGLLVAADRALYAAKAAGRRRVATWEDGSIAIGRPLDGMEQLALGAA